MAHRPALLGGLCPKCTAGSFLLEEIIEAAADEDLRSRPAEFRIREKIGEGGMGEIRSADETEFGRTVAVKWLKEDRREDPSARSRFLAEARITAQLEHPGIVPIYAKGVRADGREFYTMRRLRGVTLAQILEGLGKGDAAIIRQYPLSALLTVFQKVCDAVAFAHSRKVIHRDLKPDNIMVGEFGEVVVMDWGLAKILSGSPDADDRCGNEFEGPLPVELSVSHQTLDRVVLGSPGFMAPEQADGRAHKSDERTDVFALGAILYAILTLNPPVAGHSSQSIIDRTKSGVIRPPTEFNTPSSAGPAVANRLTHCPNGRVPASLSAVVMKALAFQPGDRYRSVQELQADITAYQTGYATAAEAAGFFTQVLLLVKRRKTEFTLSAAAFAIILALAGAFFAKVTATLNELQLTAPSFEAEARTLLEQGNLTNALEKIRYAEKLRPSDGAYKNQEANILQSLFRLSEARAAYFDALKLSPGNELARTNIQLCDELGSGERQGENPAAEKLEKLRAALVSQNRVAEAVFVAKQLASGPVESLKKWGEYLKKAGFPGTLSEAKDGGLELDIAGTAITNLNVLKGVPLAVLRAGGTRISDLEPLRGMPLRILQVQSTSVEDLSPLRGMPLIELNISRTKVTHFSALRGLSLWYLIAQVLPVKDLSPLAGMPLRYLNLYGCGKIADLRPLKGMPLEMADFYASWVTDLSPLSAMPLVYLNIEASLVEDLEPLRRTPLHNLEMGTTRVRDLSPLSALPLTNLVLKNNPIVSVEPLRGMPLQRLWLDACNQLKDLGPIASCISLEYLTIPRTATNAGVLRSLPKLRRLSYFSPDDRGWDDLPTPEEFWKNLSPENARPPSN